MKDSKNVDTQIWLKFSELELRTLLQCLYNSDPKKEDDSKLSKVLSVENYNSSFEKVSEAVNFLKTPASSYFSKSVRITDGSHELISLGLPESPSKGVIDKEKLIKMLKGFLGDITSNKKYNLPDAMIDIDPYLALTQVSLKSNKRLLDFILGNIENNPFIEP